MLFCVRTKSRNQRRKLPTNLEFIGESCFENCSNLYGELHLPDKLKELGEWAFRQCSHLTGSLEIPQGVTAIKDNTFEYCGFDGTLKLHDGIISIGNYAFRGTHFKGELVLPKDLLVLNEYVFSGCDFSGELVLPKKLRSIGNNVFGSIEDGANWRLMGIVEIPEDVISIGTEAFYGCRSIEGLVFPEALENIMDGAFNECYGIGSIVCKGSVPAHVQASAFNGVANDYFAVEVTEPGVQQYQSSAGWREF